VVDVGQLEGGSGTDEVWAHDDNMGTLGQQGHGKGLVSMGSGNLANDWQVVYVFGKATGPGEKRAIMESEIDREVIHAIPTTE